MSGWDIVLKAIPPYFNKSGLTEKFPLDAAFLSVLLLLLELLPSDVLPNVVDISFSYKYINLGENCIINTAKAPIEIPNVLNICNVPGSEANR